MRDGAFQFKSMALLQSKKTTFVVFSFVRLRERIDQP